MERHETKGHGQRHPLGKGVRMRRAHARRAVLLILAAAPTASLAWSAGCADSHSSSGVAYVDPGGTYGAEVTIRVVGRGRVSADIPGIDCPVNCFARYIFMDANQDGAAGGVTLKASSTVAGVRFDGWKFETTTPLGTRGRGPDNCNPVTRPGTDPSVDGNAEEIKLPFGQTNGTVPAGQEAVCSPYAAVPVAYNITATFTDTTEAGVDGGASEVVYESPVLGASGGEIGIPTGYSRLYWRFQSGGLSGVATGLTTPGLLPATPTTIVPATTTIPFFKVDQNALYTTGTGTVNIVIANSTLSTSLPTPPTCIGLASDFSNVFCRANDASVVTWNTSGSIGPTTVYTGMPSGAPLADDGTYLYVVDDPGTAGLAAIRRMSRITSTIDAGAPVFTDLATGRTGPNSLQVGSTNMFWIESDTFGTGTALTSSKSFLGTPTTLAPATSGLKFIVADPSNTTVAWLGNPTTGQILKATTTAPGAPTVFRSAIIGLGGVAVDFNYVYWTASDGRVYRASKI